MPKNKKLKYHRILLKLSGESLLGSQSFGIDAQAVHRVAGVIKKALKLGVEVGLVIGGGNLFRGVNLVKSGIGRVSSDQMGMLATVMNGIAMRDVFTENGIQVHLMSSITMHGVVEQFDYLKAKNYLSLGHVVVFVGGTGNPLFSTDSCASLRGIEIDADVILKATKVDGVYSADPMKDKTAKRYKKLSYQEVIERQLQVMDATAICMCRENNMPLIVFDMNKKDSLMNVLLGEKEGTLISN